MSIATNAAEGQSPLQDTQAIHFTVSAAEKVAALIAEENNPLLNLRLYITGGGCSGFQYGFTFEETIQEDDTVIEQQCTDGKTVKLLIDPMSIQYLGGAEIDFIPGLQERFAVRNPNNAKTTCGCGSSFSMGDDE